MTTFFFRRSVERAFQLDEQPSDLNLDPRKPISTHSPYVTSAVDDVMFIVDQIVERLLETSQRAVVSSVIPTISRILGSDFIGMIQRKMREESYPKAAVQGALPAEQDTIAFLVLINNLDVAVDYMHRIVSSRVDTASSVRSITENGSGLSASLSNSFPLDRDAAAITSALNSLQGSFDSKALELIGDGIFVVFKNVVKPRLRPILADAFRDVDYQLTQEDLDEEKAAAEMEGRDGDLSDAIVQEHFQQGWDHLTKPMIRLLTERNFEKLLTLMIPYLGEVLEKRIWSYYGRIDDLGAARLERDIASIASIVVRGGRYRLRESFARCTQICMVMNMEDDEWEEVQDMLSEARDKGIDWQLDLDELVRARAMMHNRER